jgi:lipoprotein-anchoring transpeptidase ErfK/SrfK
MGLVTAVATLSVTLLTSAPSEAYIAPIRPGAAIPADTASASLSVVAQVRGSSIPVFTTPTSKKAYEVLHSPTAAGDPLVFLVSGAAANSTWLHVYLPSRPNQSQGWIESSAVTLSADEFLVDVDLSSHVMTVFNNGLSMLSVKIGEGRATLPTPTGTYYIVDLLKQPNPGGEYGPYAFGLSAFSNVLQSFGGGPGEIGIHGTNEVGSFGASISHGCIRVPNNMISALAKLLPLGTPVLINQ